MNMTLLLDKYDFILMEAAVVERLRRDSSVVLHPSLVHAALLYDESGRQELQKLYQSYIDIAVEARSPLLLCTPTWRANQERVHESAFNPAVNADAVQFMMSLRDMQRPQSTTIKIAGLIGCRNDCYKPEEGLSPGDSERFHSWQINRLAEAGVDCLLATTLPNIQEAIGIARAMAATGEAYMISFVINRAGRVLDGTPLSEAICTLDEATPKPPAGFMVNCAHPTFLCAASQPRQLFTRLIGYQGNASALDQIDLDGQSQIQVDDIAEWAREMMLLNQEYGLKILGGCCGTGADHLKQLLVTRKATKG